MLFDECRDVKRLDVDQFELVFFTPAEKPLNRSGIRKSGVPVANVSREEFDESPRRFFPGLSNDSWKAVQPDFGKRAFLCNDNVCFVAHAPPANVNAT